MDYHKFLLALIICFLLSLLVGLERQSRRRSAGLRTTVLVAIGSYLFVSFSFLVTDYQIDISRVASQVVTGIGFLGAGVIIKDGAKVRGLTTAATLWCTASIGVLCAGGYVKEAITGTIVILFSNIILRYVNSFINMRSINRITKEIYRMQVSLTKEKRQSLIEYIENNKEEKITIDNVNVTENDVTFDINIVKSNETVLGKYITKLINRFSIKEYNYKKIEEKTQEEEYDEL